MTTPDQRWRGQQHNRRVLFLGDHRAGEWEQLVAQKFDGIPVDQEEILALMLGAYRQGRTERRRRRWAALNVRAALRRYLDPPTH
jgi:hypothetical protein